MRALIQRVLSAEVTIAQRVSGSIGPGLLILVGIGADDGAEDVDWLAQKISDLRIFSDDTGKMNHSVNEIQGGVLIVSQFTLHASIKKGTRPSFIKAASPDIAIPLYERFIAAMTLLSNGHVATGEFGTDMQISLINDGPVTIWIDTKNKQ